MGFSFYWTSELVVHGVLMVTAEHRAGSKRISCLYHMHGHPFGQSRSHQSKSAGGRNLITLHEAVAEVWLNGTLQGSEERGPAICLTHSTAATQSLTHFYSLLSFDTLIVELFIAYLSFVTKSSAP